MGYGADFKSAVTRLQGRGGHLRRLLSIEAASGEAPV